MSDQRTLESISQFDAGDEEVHAGSIYLLKWLQETWGEAGKAVVMQFVVFYALMLIGFLMLYGMMRSTAKLRELRRNMGELLREQRERKFDIEDYRHMAGGGYF